jgi:hypothetical protein
VLIYEATCQVQALPVAKRNQSICVSCAKAGEETDSLWLRIDEPAGRCSGNGARFLLRLNALEAHFFLADLARVKKDGVVPYVSDGGDRAPAPRQIPARAGIGVIDDNEELEHRGRLSAVPYGHVVQVKIVLA